MAPKVIPAGTQVSPPRPAHSRKVSTANTPSGSPEKVKKTKDAREKEEEAKKMPPPPPPAKPMAILEPEINALEDCLKNVTVTTAQIFKFHANIKRLGVQRHVPNPPRTMTLSLEYELRRYDQICDSLDSQLSRAVAVLQRDLEREEEKVREAEAEKARAKAAEPPQADTDVEMGAPMSEIVPSGLQSSPPSGAITGAGRAPLRRPSKNFSLSTLHRNPFPLKLDLPSSALRLDSEDGGLDISSLGDLSTFGNIGSLVAVTGLASPVTLAPKSARAMEPDELPPDVLAALASAPSNINHPDQSAPQQSSIQLPASSSDSAVDIDLTLDDSLPAGIDILSAGSSADKPIELDLDLDVQMGDIDMTAAGVFGDQSEAVARQSQQDVAGLDSLFSPVNAGQASDLPGTGNSAEGMDISILNALSGGQEQSDTDAFLASLSAHDGGPQGDANTSHQVNIGGENGGNNEFDFSQLDMSNMGDMSSVSDLFGSADTESGGGEGMEDLHKLLGMAQDAPDAGGGEAGASNSIEGTSTDTGLSQPAHHEENSAATT